MLENPMYLADPPEPEPCSDWPDDADMTAGLADHETRTVDLKWSLWSLDKETWEERSPGTWDWMRDWFEASGDPGNPEMPELTDSPRVVSTAPRKEIRVGEVAIYSGYAIVRFSAEWDNGRTFQANGHVEAETFTELMHLIDHLELDLIREQHEAYHGKQGGKLTHLRCHECGYPYTSPTSRRYA